MANTMRWRYGDTNPVVLPVDSATVIEIGDLVYLDTDDAQPAARRPTSGTEAANQELFHDKFAGVAMQRSPQRRHAADPRGHDRRVRVRLPVGDVRSRRPDRRRRNGRRHGAREPAVVATVATPNLAIGRCAKRVNPAGTGCWSTSSARSRTAARKRRRSGEVRGQDSEDGRR